MPRVFFNDYVMPFRAKAGTDIVLRTLFPRLL